MELFNYHLHSTGSDGKLSPEEIVKLALKLKFGTICFTDHYKIPKDLRSDNYYDGFFSTKYIKEIKHLQEKYKNKIEILFGGEFDWSESHEGWFREGAKKERYDFILGSVHGFRDLEGNHIGVNMNKENIKLLIQSFGTAKKAVKEYYHQVRLMVKSGIYDCVAHLDLIKSYNENNEFFSEDEAWYKQEVLETLDLVKKHKMSIEINPLAIYYPCNEDIFPSLWILKEMHKREIPVTLGNDFHRGEFDRGIEKSISILKQAGYTHVEKFKNRKPISVKI